MTGADLINKMEPPKYRYLSKQLYKVTLCYYRLLFRLLGKMVRDKHQLNNVVGDISRNPLKYPGVKITCTHKDTTIDGDLYIKIDTHFHFKNRGNDNA